MTETKPKPCAASVSRNVATRAGGCHVPVLGHELRDIGGVSSPYFWCQFVQRYVPAQLLGETLRFPCKAGVPPNA
jgi:hypothetical protein